MTIFKAIRPIVLSTVIAVVLYVVTIYFGVTQQIPDAQKHLFGLFLGCTGVFLGFTLDYFVWLRNA